MSSKEDAHAAIERLKKEKPQVAKATHNISAFRSVSACDGEVTCGHNDDGEHGAAVRLSHILERSGRTASGVLHSLL